MDLGFSLQRYVRQWSLSVFRPYFVSWWTNQSLGSDWQIKNRSDRLSRSYAVQCGRSIQCSRVKPPRGIAVDRIYPFVFMYWDTKKIRLLGMDTNVAIFLLDNIWNDLFQSFLFPYARGCMKGWKHSCNIKSPKCNEPLKGTMRNWYRSLSSGSHNFVVSSSIWSSFSNGEVALVMTLCLHPKWWS